MNVVQEAIEVVDALGEGYDFWQLCRWTAEQEGGFVIIKPDFIGVAQLEGDTINVWLAIGDDGVRKAIELAPPSAKFAQWKRGIYDKESSPRIWPLDRIRQYLNERSLQQAVESNIRGPADHQADAKAEGTPDNRRLGSGQEHGNTERHGVK